MDIINDYLQFLLVSNSSILCKVSLEELEAIFLPLDEDAEFIVYPNKRSYSFVQCSSVEKAITVRSELHGLIPQSLKNSHQPFIISFVQNCEFRKKFNIFFLFLLKCLLVVI